MTICIAAIAENRYVVMAADRTLTLALEPEEFAHKHSSKLYEVEDKFMIGSAGTPVYIPEFLSAMRSGGLAHKPPLERLSEALHTVRRNAMERSILHRFGLSYAKYEKVLASGQLTEIQARIIGEEMDGFHACLHVVAGTVNGQGSASVYSAEDCGMEPTGRVPKQVFCHDAIGWVATGSGQSYADQTLVRSNCTNDMGLGEVLFHVFEAKKNAEQAIGVGRETDLRIVGPSGSIKVPDDQVRGLGRLLEAEQARQQKRLTATLKAAEEMVGETVRLVSQASTRASRRSSRGRTG